MIARGDYYEITINASLGVIVVKQEKEPHDQVCWRINRAVLEAIKAQARQHDRPVNWMVNRLLSEVVSQKGAQQ